MIYGRDGLLDRKTSRSDRGREKPQLAGLTYTHTLAQSNLATKVHKVLLRFTRTMIPLLVELNEDRIQDFGLREPKPDKMSQLLRKKKPFRDHLLCCAVHRFTYPKGVHSYRYFLQPTRTPNLLMHIFIFPNSFVICSCMYASLLQLDLYVYTMVYALAV